MLARYTASMGSAGLITLALLFLMQQMIAMGRPVVGDDKAIRIQPFVTVERPPPDIPVDTRPEPLPEPADPPDIPSLDTGVTDGLQISVRPPTAPTMGGDSTVSFGLTDGDLMAIVKVRPNYPVSALRRDLEGQVLVEFTVNANGTVSDVVVIESSNSVFERAAVEAAYKFRYRPRVISGTAVAVTGVRNLITFEIAD